MSYFHFINFFWFSLLFGCNLLNMLVVRLLEKKEPSGEEEIVLSARTCYAKFARPKDSKTLIILMNFLFHFHYLVVTPNTLLYRSHISL